VIVVVGKIKTDADKRAQLIEVCEAVAAASRAEDGCVDYRLYADTEADTDFVIVEEWESDEALKRHFTAPHVAAFLAALPATLVAPPDVKFHTVASTRDLGEISVP
jgi:quinol monooxygenase YgiN